MFEARIYMKFDIFAQFHIPHLLKIHFSFEAMQYTGSTGFIMQMCRILSQIFDLDLLK